VALCALMFDLFNETTKKHEQGIWPCWMELTSLRMLFLSPLTSFPHFPSPIAGQVITHLGWRWTFKLFNISCGILFLLQFFCSKSMDADGLSSVYYNFVKCQKRRFVVKS
jgi:hypothetical protein